MKICIALFTVFVSFTSLFAQNTPATKGDILRMEERIDKKFETLIHQMDKRFEQVDKRLDMMQDQMDKRLEQIDKRFEDMYNMFMFAFWGLFTVSLGCFGFLYNQNRKPLDAKQVASILMNAEPYDKRKIRQQLEDILQTS